MYTSYYTISFMGIFIKLDYRMGQQAWEGVKHFWTLGGSTIFNLNHAISLNKKMYQLGEGGSTMFGVIKIFGLILVGAKHLAELLARCTHSHPMISE